MPEFDKPITITPTSVIGVFDPRQREYTHVNQSQANEAAIKGRIIHRLIELSLTHHQDNPDPLTSFIRRYPSPISIERTYSVNLGPNITLWAKPDLVVGRPGQNCLCLEIKPGKKGKPVGGLQGRYVLQTVLNGLTISLRSPPDLALFLYHSDTIVKIDKPIRQDLVLLATTLAISAAKIISTQTLCDNLERMATQKRTTKTGQAYLFFHNQLSPEYQQSQTDLPLLHQTNIDERRNIFDPTLKQFIRICQRIK